ARREQLSRSWAAKAPCPLTRFRNQESVMTRKNLLICSFSIGTLLAQSAPQAQQATDFKGVVRKNFAPISSEVLRVKFPKPVESKLKNGMSLLVLEDHRSPTIQVRIAIPASN